MKVLSIVGARPQLIKLAEIHKASVDIFNHKIIHTGQHYDSNMSKDFFNELQIQEPDFNLGVGSGTHSLQTSLMIAGIDKIISEEKPDYVLLYGDTNSTLAGAIVSSKYSEIKTGHVEAGLRSFNRKMPEEINRIITDHISHNHFCPTEEAVQNLKKEGIANGVFLTGDVMCDSVIKNQLDDDLTISLLNKYGLSEKSYNLLTLHRPQNVDNMETLSSFLDSFSKINKKIFWPLHPRTKNNLNKFNLEKSIPSNIILSPPLGYRQMLCLIKNSFKVMTDSGGVQKESYILRKQCITLRDDTEWVETLTNGWNVLVGKDQKLLLAESNNKVESQNHKNYYGEGDASGKIVRIILDSVR